LDELFGREAFLNELIWSYDYGAKPRRRWPAKHDTILVYVRTPGGHWFDADAVEREPYMAPGLVSAEKAARGKRPTDVWFHTIVPTNGREKTGYPTQKPEGVLRRLVAASSRAGGWCLDPFAGSGTLGAVCQALGRRFVLVDHNPVAIEVMRDRLGGAGAAANARRPDLLGGAGAAANGGAGAPANARRPDRSFPGSDRLFPGSDPLFPGTVDQGHELNGL
ncbi:MAG: site-specific DNA-methyltransferase, partial [Solirubrobacterales bacterium]|nr:site-specific DNA-methyltransferase [Solirubrobacterales bacterium]